MQLPQEAIEEFRMIYQKEYGVLLPDEETTKLALDVYEFFKIIAKSVDKKAMSSFKIKKGAV